MSTGASSIREPSVIKINASDEDGDESMADKTSEEELGKFNFYVILFSLTNAIWPENALKKLAALLPMDFSRVISRSALKTVGLFIFFKCAARSRLVGFVIIKIQKIMWPPQTLRPIQSS